MGMDQYAYITKKMPSRRMFSEYMEKHYFNVYDENCDINEVWEGRNYRDINRAIEQLHKHKYGEDFPYGGYTELKFADIAYLDSVIGELDGVEKDKYEELLAHIWSASRRNCKLFYGADW